MADTIAIFSDCHVNSTLGLCPPAVTLDDGGTYRASKAQRWIWSEWLKYWQTVKQRHAENGGRLILISNGDLVDGYHHRTHQIITTNITTQNRIAVDALEPALSLNPDKIYIVRGTEAHVGGSAADEEAIAEDIGAEMCGDTKTHSWWHLPLQVQSVRMDIAHHGRAGTREHTRANATLGLAAELTFQYLERSEKLPQLAIRSHRHRPADTFDNYPVRVIQLPSWQLSTAYGHKIAAGSVLPIGAIIVTVDGYDYAVDKHICRPARTRWERA